MWRFQLDVCVLAILIGIIGCFSIRYLDSSGFDIPNVSLHTSFRVLVEENNRTTVLRASNHPYKSSIHVGGDPCLYELYGRFQSISDDRNNASKEGKKSESLADSHVGIFNVCTRILEYKAGDWKREIKYVEESYRIRTGRMEGEENGLSNDRTITAFSKKDTSANKENQSKTTIDDPINKVGVSLTKNYRINVFIFNDFQRAQSFGTEINKETMKVFELVGNIYLESHALIKINLSGILNLKEQLDLGPDILGGFREKIEPMRYDPSNLSTPVSTADLVILLTDQIPGQVYDVINHGIRHGMSYFGGANGLNRSYGVVYANPGDSRYFIAKKIAHEIAHSLGVHHDEEDGFLMESGTCKDCNESKRVFSKDSIEQMNRFIGMYSDLFEERDLMPDTRVPLVMSLTQANTYVKKKEETLIFSNCC